MNTFMILLELDAEIAKLNRARAVLIEEQIEVPQPPTPGKRYISPAARKRMAAAQKHRWAKYRAGNKASHSRKLAWKGKLLHWTQKPENKRKVRKQLKRMRALRDYSNRRSA